MSADRAVIASFNYILPARILGGSDFSSIQSAYDSAANNDIIQAREFEFSENLLLNRSIAVKIKGGYDATYTTNSGYSAMNGTMKIRSGLVRVEKLKIKSSLYTSPRSTGG
jgi:pectin methylesterase-like acyl-CoA thioesterase